MLVKGTTGCLNQWWPGSLMHWCIKHIEAETNGRHFADDIFKCIFLNENAWISLEISLKYVPKVQINNIAALVQIMAWRRPGNKPLSEPMVVSLLTHICVTRPQWVNMPQCGNHSYRQTSNISCTESQNLNDSHFILQLYLCNLLKPGGKSRMKM